MKNKVPKVTNRNPIIYNFLEVLGYYLLLTPGILILWTSRLSNYMFFLYDNFFLYFLYNQVNIVAAKKKNICP